MKNRIKHYSPSPVSDDAAADVSLTARDAEDALDDESLDLPAVDAADAVVPIVVEIPETLHGERLDKVLAKLLPDYSRSRLQQWIDAGAVRVDGAAVRPRAAVSGGARVEVVPQRAADEHAFVAEPVDLDVIYEDDTLLVINKPAGLVVHPAAGNWSGTVLNGLLYRYPDAAALPRAGIVHRLDKETSGLMVVARTLPAQTDLVRQLQARTVKRTYLALVWGETPEEGTIDAPIGRDPRDRTRMAIIETASGKPARTHFKTLDVVDLGRAQISLVRCQLETGRTHQIRVHFESEGHPLVGDPVYTRNFRRGRPQTIKAPLPVPFARQALHAVRLGLVHPASGKSVHWEAPVPEDFAALMEALDLDPDVELT
ncbi:Ribosomal large subunit pseudouridine synthase D [Ralstonia condita]|uniref:Pseudouridine synthase n=1 Tax=Ralstonia condita TaxID=3058600 RepID=A0ABN9IGI9_9RALS|nr:RluA family pseudouridine synthase [Ralstonia sp. LMG 7141]MDE2203002.1 RluA family pseudouridine synthase [Burkholderiaceae bacterium]CAJ0780619.1 Ribosomal large subunit pseudouridine synthase D [Ralstonia sp. LMG 7141]